MALPAAPPLLLTKRLTTFLRANLSPQITSALLLMPSGRLLAYACQPAVPVSTLRTQGTVAASLWAIHSHGTDRDSISSALGQQQPATTTSRGGNTSAGSREPSAVTMQLDGGNIVVIRRLRCGMLFVCIGPTQPADAQQQQQAPLAAEPPPHERNGLPHHSHNHNQQQQQQHLAPSHATSSPTVGSPSASEVESVLSVATGVATLGSTATTSSFAGSATAGIIATRRHAEALAVWLDDKLGTLNVPEETFSIA